MVGSTAGKLAGKAAAAAKKVTAAVAATAGQVERTPAEAASPPSPTARRTAKKAGADAEPVAPTEPPAAPRPAAGRAPAAAKKGAPAARKTTAAAKKATAAKPTPPVKGAAKKAAPPSRTPRAATRPAKAAGKGSGGAAEGAAGGAAGGAAALPVKADEDPWTPEELAGVRAELDADVARLRQELDLATRELDDLMRNAGDGAGNDQADMGSTTFERDHELSLANNARGLLQQTEHALERIADGSYGRCESCGQPVGKNRLMAFPRATLCLTCKQREERR